MLRFAIIGLMAMAVPAKPLFAGWVRSAEGQVQLRSGSEVKTFPAANSRGIRLYAGQQVRSIKGTANLLIFGKELGLKSERGWYVVPDEAKKAPAGRDAYSKYLLRAGRERDAGFSERLWLALSLTELTNPKPIGPVNLRLAPNIKSFKVGDEIGIEVRNDASLPLYFSVFDIDCEGTVQRLIAAVKVPAKSGWVALPDKYRLALPAGWTQGTEVFKVVATEKSVDLRALETRNEVRRPEAPDPAMNPLEALVWTLSSGPAEADFGAWSVASVTFQIKK